MVKYMKDSKIEVTKVIDEWVDENGVKHREVSKDIASGPIKLGSIRKPINEDIIKIEVFIPRKITNGMGMIDFSSLFG